MDKTIEVLELENNRKTLKIKQLKNFKTEIMQMKQKYNN